MCYAGLNQVSFPAQDCYPELNRAWFRPGQRRSLWGDALIWERTLIGPEFGADFHESFPCRAVTTCRHFGWCSLMCASFAPRGQLTDAQYASTPRARKLPRSAIFADSFIGPPILVESRRRIFTRGVESAASGRPTGYFRSTSDRRRRLDWADSRFCRVKEGQRDNSPNFVATERGNLLLLMV